MHVAGIFAKADNFEFASHQHLALYANCHVQVHSAKLAITGVMLYIARLHAWTVTWHSVSHKCHDMRVLCALMQRDIE